MGRPSTWTDGEIVAALEAVAVDDPGVTLMEFSRVSGVSYYLIYKRFGSWPALRERAGLEPRGRLGAPRQVTAEELRERFREALDEVGPTITLDQFAERAGVAAETIKRRFGSWGRLRESFGLGTRCGPERIPAGEIRAALREAVAEFGPTLTFEQFVERSGYSETAIRRRFGSWTELRRLEEVPENKPGPPRISDEELLADYERVRQVLGRRPTFAELGTLSFYGESTFRKRFELFRWRAAIRRRCEKAAARRLHPDRADET